ncbi:MAG: ferritin-like domain-containing protein [Acidimicrobiales bacterium]
MQISTKELRQLAEDVDDLQRDAMRTLRDELEEVHFGETATVLRSNRRHFLTRAGAGGVTLAVGSAIVPITRFLAPAAAQELDDATIAAFAESVELAAVEAYMAAAGSGKLDAAVVQVGTMFAGHHQEHAAAFGGLAGATATGEPNQPILDAFGPMIAAAPDQAGLLEIAFGLEQAAAATYLFALGALQSPQAAAATATVLPVESQHAVVLGFALGKDVADFMPAFETADAALNPADYPIG